MKIYGIFRGFPGLGRVVSGLNLLNKLKEYGNEVKLFTYYQGIPIIKNYGYNTINVISNKDISSVGIIPVSSTGEQIINEINTWSPDIIICDGEPLMVECLKISGIKSKIISLVNPLDLYNTNNNKTSMKYFRYLYRKSDMIICHGINNKRYHYGNVYNVNTIIRDEIFTIKKYKKAQITCILGGGTTNCSNNFKNSTIKIFKKILFLAKNNKESNFDIFCNDELLGKSLKKYITCKNIKLITKYTSPVSIYKNSKLVICRAGRNTISELLYLKIPAIIISTHGDIRSIEQDCNIKDAIMLSNGNLQGYNLNESNKKLLELFKKNINKQNIKYSWLPGNKEVYNLISSMYKLF